MKPNKSRKVRGYGVPALTGMGLSLVRVALTFPLFCAMGYHNGYRYEDRPNVCETCGFWT